jgi:hypothetical protein
MRAADPWKSTETTLAPHASAGVVVGLPLRGVRTPCGQSGSLCGLKLVPSKWRYLVPPTSTPQKAAGHNASRWAAQIVTIFAKI